MKVWITKYALTQGIYEANVTLSASPSMVCGSGVFEHYHGEGKEWHRTKEQAVNKARDMQTAKLASLAKSIARIKMLKFE